MMFKNESKDSNKFLFTILITFLIIIVVGIGLIYYLVTPHKAPNNNGIYKPPTIYNSPVVIRNNTLKSNITQYNYLQNTNRTYIYPLNNITNKTAYFGKHCCYPPECASLYNNTNCDKSCEYPVYCFTLKPNETLQQHLIENHYINYIN